MHTFFDHYINSRSILKSLVENYETIAKEKYDKEMTTEHKYRYTKERALSLFSWET